MISKNATVSIHNEGIDINLHGIKNLKTLIKEIKSQLKNINISNSGSLSWITLQIENNEISLLQSA